MSTGALQITLHELCECVEIPEDVVLTAVEHDVITPLPDASDGQWVFDTVTVIWLRKAVHLRRDLDLDWVAIAMVIDLLREREALDRENQGLKERLQRLTDDA